MIGKYMEGDAHKNFTINTIDLIFWNFVVEKQYANF